MDSCSLVGSQRKHTAKSFKPDVVPVFNPGVFILTDNAPELREIFGSDLKVPVFTDPADLRAKLIYYLKAEEECRTIASSMYAHIQRYDTYADRMRQLVTG